MDISWLLIGCLVSTIMWSRYPQFLSFQLRLHFYYDQHIEQTLFRSFGWYIFDKFDIMKYFVKLPFKSLYLSFWLVIDKFDPNEVLKVQQAKTKCLLCTKPNVFAAILIEMRKACRHHIVFALRLLISFHFCGWVPIGNLQRKILN